MMAGMLTQLPLPLLPAGAAEIAPGVGLVAGDEGGGPAGAMNWSPVIVHAGPPSEVSCQLNPVVGFSGRRTSIV